MSKIGRKPIETGSVKIEIKNNEIHYTGKKKSGVYTLPDLLAAEVRDAHLFITAARKTSDTHRIWGLHRALLNNAIIGADRGFEKQLRIVGLGFKAAMIGGKLQFALGFSHKIDFDLPSIVSIEIDKTGQLLTLRSVEKDVLGLVCSKIRALRSPEPYKGTGIQYVGETIRRKAGKAKSA